jgi:hypothetical protein
MRVSSLTLRVFHPVVTLPVRRNVPGHKSQPWEAQMKSIASSAALLAAPLLTIAGIVGIATAQDKSPAAKPMPVVLFVQPASGMTFKEGVLTMKNVPQNTYFFSDRPERITGQIRNDMFVNYWNGDDKNSLKNVPPNAALAVGGPEGRPTGAIVMLSNPRMQGSDMMYDVKTMAGDLPAEAGQTVLFIDDVAAPCSPEYSVALWGYPCWAQRAFSGDQRR